jgi:hypothetical protein
MGTSRTRFLDQANGEAGEDQVSKWEKGADPTMTNKGAKTNCFAVCTRLFTWDLLIALMLKAVRTSETSSCFYETTLRHIAEGCQLLIVAMRT